MSGTLAQSFVSRGPMSPQPLRCSDKGLCTRLWKLSKTPFPGHGLSTRHFIVEKPTWLAYQRHTPRIMALLSQTKRSRCLRKAVCTIAMNCNHPVMSWDGKDVI
jgi:hypothetical protein